VIVKSTTEDGLGSTTLLSAAAELLFEGEPLLVLLLSLELVGVTPFEVGSPAPD
jgi:hypothetical protein